MEKTLIIMTRVPIPGQTKTRMMPHLTEEQCAGFHKACLKDIAGLQKQLKVPTHVFFTGKISKSFTDIFPLGTKFIPQEGETLGERMAKAFHFCFRSYSKVVMIGSDLPHLPLDYLKEAFFALDNNDVVLGPAMDGGYYLIGLRGEQPSLFKGIKWGSNEVLNETLRIINSQGLKYTLLNVLQDLDTVEDLEAFLTNRKNINTHAWKYLVENFKR